MSGRLRSRTTQGTGVFGRVAAGPTASVKLATTSNTSDDRREMDTFVTLIEIRDHRSSAAVLQFGGPSHNHTM